MTGRDMYQRDALRQMLGEPALWPRAVEARLLGIISTLRAGLALPKEESDFLARFFIFPNLARWIMKMRGRTQATPYAGECPIHGGPRDCSAALFEVPAASTAGERGDWCRSAEPGRPWELQVSLLWNNYRRLQDYATTPQSQRREFPSVKCASEVYRRAVDQPVVRQRWTGLGEARPKEVQAQWRELMDRLDKVLNWTGTLEWPKVREQLLNGDVHGQLARLTAAVNQALAECLRKQDAAANPQAARIEAAVLPVSQPLLLHVNVLRQPWPTAPNQAVIQDFLLLLDEVQAPDRPTLVAMFTEPALAPRQQREVLRYIEKELMPLRRRGRLPGDPLDDPLLHDLFWQRVGGAGPMQFQAFAFRPWCQETWSAVGAQDEEGPRWNSPT